MRILIENYRGWDISFDTEKEEFYCISNEYDDDKNKKSYKSAKKYIDDYIKNNTEFKPFEVMRFQSQYEGRKIIKIIGIRKDGRFVYEDEKGEKQQISDYTEKSWFLINEANEPIENEIAKLHHIIEKTNKSIKELESKLIKVSLAQIKSKYITN